jgi:hypothetical protein
MTDRFECVRTYDPETDTFAYAALRNSVMDRKYTVKFEILDENGNCIATNPPVIQQNQNLLKGRDWDWVRACAALKGEK